MLIFHFRLTGKRDGESDLSRIHCYHLMAFPNQLNQYHVEYVAGDPQIVEQLQCLRLKLNSPNLRRVGAPMDLLRYFLKHPIEKILN